MQASTGSHCVSLYYRKVATVSSVDDTLFGGGKKTSAAQKPEKMTLTLANILPGVRATVRCVGLSPRRAQALQICKR